jgi:RimJ/RimL family protein N-acetyltransferase
MIQSLSEDPFYKFVFCVDQPFSSEFNKNYSATNSYTDLPSKNSTSYFHYIVRQDDIHFLAYIGGFYPQQAHVLWIQQFIVNKPFAHKGYGTVIMRQFIQSLQSNGFYRKIYLTCHKDNILGDYFWKKLGFKRIKNNIQQTHNLFCADIRS